MLPHLEPLLLSPIHLVLPGSIVLAILAILLVLATRDE